MMEIENERKKSVADEATIKKLEKELDKKIKEANKKQDEFYQVAEKIQLTEN